jgi:hypothetical protein
MGSTCMLPAATNHQVACRLLLTGDIISAQVREWRQTDRRSGTTCVCLFLWVSTCEDLRSYLIMSVLHAFPRHAHVWCCCSLHLLVQPAQGKRWLVLSFGVSCLCAQLHMHVCYGCACFA